MGKTALATRFLEDRFGEEFLPTLGIAYEERRVPLGNACDAIFAVFDMGADEEYLPLAVDEASAVVFAFDLTRKSSLISIKDQFRKVRLLNPRCPVFLVGTKFDLFLDQEAAFQKDVTQLARQFAKSMNSPLVFTSASHCVNVQKTFKIVLAQVLNVPCLVDQVRGEGEPLIEFF